MPALHRLRASLLILLCCLPPGLSLGQELPRTAAKPTPTVTALFDLQGKPVTLQQADNRKATVFFFVVRDCPIANSYAPEIVRLVNDYAAKRIVSYLVYVDSDVGVGVLRKHYREFGYRCTALRDEKQMLVRQYQVQRTPETVVLDGTGRVVYQGRIDDMYTDFGKARHQAERRDLRLVLDALVEGRIPSPTRTVAIGCPIPP